MKYLSTILTLLVFLCCFINTSAADQNSKDCSVSNINNWIQIHTLMDNNGIAQGNVYIRPTHTNTFDALLIIKNIDLGKPNILYFVNGRKLLNSTCRLEADISNSMLVNYDGTFYGYKLIDKKSDRVIFSYIGKLSDGSDPSDFITVGWNPKSNKFEFMP